jgi:hypothetical protein
MDLLVHLDWSVRKSTPRMWACHVANQSVECRLSTGLGHRHGIPSPGEAPCIPDGRVGVIGRVHAPTGWGEILGLAPAQVPVRSGRVLLDPRLSEDGNRRDLAAPARSRCLSESAEPLDAIGADLFGIGIALGCALGSAGCLETCAIARQPVGGPLVAEPIRGHERQIIARRTERFPPTCQAIERPDSGHDRGGVGARPSPSFPPATGVKPGQQDSEAHLFRSPWHQTCPKRGEDRVVNARIGELQPHGILPVETTATASAACRAVKASAHGLMVTHARRHGASAGGPRGGSSVPKAASSSIVPNRVRLCMHREGRGKAAWATRRVSSGIVWTAWEARDMT